MSSIGQANYTRKIKTFDSFYDSLQIALSDEKAKVGQRVRCADYADGDGAGMIFGEWVAAGVIIPDFGNPEHDSLPLVFKQSFEGVVNSRQFGSGVAIIHVSPTGDDSNSGFNADYPKQTVQSAFDSLSELGPYLMGSWAVHLVDGVHTDGGVLQYMQTENPLLVYGDSKESTIIDGTTATTTSGLNFNVCGNIRVANLTVRNWAGAGSGIIFQNGTRGVIDTCLAQDNTEANFNCSEDSEIVLVGVCESVGSKYGLRVYRNSSASVGDNTNAITITGATGAGIVSRDGSQIVTVDNLIITGCNAFSSTSAIWIYKNSYLELRTCTITGNSKGVVAEHSGILDTQTGTRNVSGNTIDYQITDFSADRSHYSSGGTATQKWVVNSAPSGLSFSGGYDLIVDSENATGLQFLTAGQNINIDFDKTSRITHVAADSTLRLTANGAEYRLSGSSLYPATDGVANLGQSFARWNTVYASSGVVTTSDGRLKQQVLDITEKEKRVALAIKGQLKSFKFNDAVHNKGNEARVHFGVIAQDVKAAFESEGLAAEKYGLFCFDEWEADENTQAGDRLGVRYDELLIFIISAM